MKIGENHALWKDTSKYTFKTNQKEDLFQCGSKEGFQDLFLG